jgi:arginase
MGSPAVLVVQQWQGSVRPAAPRLAAGAAQLAELAREAGAAVRECGSLPTARSPARAGVDSLDAILTAQAQIAQALPGGPTLAIGGDCGADLALAARELRARDGDLAILWIDAHADFNSPASSPSGAFHGMVLRCLTGTGPGELVPPVPAAYATLVLAGTRSIDPAEREALAAGEIVPLGMLALAEPDTVRAALRRTGRSAVHVHLDLDVLDPQVFPDTTYQAPGGASVGQVQALLRAAGSALPVASAFIGEHLGGEPGSTRIVGPLLRELLGLMSAGGRVTRLGSR